VLRLGELVVSRKRAPMNKHLRGAVEGFVQRGRISPEGEDVRRGAVAIGRPFTGVHDWLDGTLRGPPE
jgi:hypothetical protein